MYERMIGMTEELEDIVGPLEGLSIHDSTYVNRQRWQSAYQYEHGYIEPRREKTFYDYEW